MIVVLAAMLVGCAPARDALPYGARAEDCAACHPDHGDEWSASAHALSLDSPVFQALLPEIEGAWGAAARARCEACHRPAFADEDAIGCVACHAAVGDHGPRDGRVAVDLTAPLAGPGLGGSTPAHASTARGYLRDAALCGSCHEVTGPALLIEHTLTEFAASPAVTDGAGCVGCHLPEVDARPWTDETPPRRSRSHRLVGLTPPWGAPADEADRASEAATDLLQQALTLDVTREDAGWRVTVTSRCDGHRVPTGVAALRDLWVEVDDGGPPRRLLQIGDQPTRDGRPVALLTEADAVTSGSLAPGESVSAVFPDDGPAIVRLRARPYRAELMDALDLSDVMGQMPTYEIARIEVNAP